MQYAVVPHASIVCLSAYTSLYITCVYLVRILFVSCLYVYMWLAKYSFVYKSTTFDCFASDIMNNLLDPRGISMHVRACVCA